MINRQHGFTLVEMIIGIVILSIAFSMFTQIVFPLSNQGAEQVHQIKAAELGQSMLNEILTKAYDENFDGNDAIRRCGDAGVPVLNCTAANALGPEMGEIRAGFDDVDDYHGLNELANSLGVAAGFAQSYIGYTINVQVIVDGNFDGTADLQNTIAKLVTVTVTTPQNFNFVFSGYRVNF